MMIRLIVSLLVLISIGSTYAYQKCRMPNGYTGECRYLVKCKPLLEVNNKKLKTDFELLYLRQSSCGTTSNFRYKVCCPLHSDWSKIETSDLKPVLFPEIVSYMSEPGDQNQTNVSTHFDAFKLNVDSEECGVQSTITNRAIDGLDTAAGEYPWLVLLEYANGRNGVCGGSLISHRHILTAGHCIDTSNGQPTSARLSEYNTTTYPMDIVPKEGGGYEYVGNMVIPVEWSIKHPLFDLDNYHHDIGLVKMVTAVRYSDFIRPICLPTIDYVEQFNGNIDFMIAGWGTNGEIYSDVKKDVAVPYMPIKTCQQYLNETTLNNKQICTEGIQNVGTCVGDSGGPLMFEFDDYYIAVGVVSYGSGCGTDNVPSVYTNVYEYVDWINNMMT